MFLGKPPTSARHNRTSRLRSRLRPARPHRCGQPSLGHPPHELHRKRTPRGSSRDPRTGIDSQYCPGCRCRSNLRPYLGHSHPPARHSHCLVHRRPRPKGSPLPHTPQRPRHCRSGCRPDTPLPLVSRQDRCSRTGLKAEGDWWGIHLPHYHSHHRYRCRPRCLESQEWRCTPLPDDRLCTPTP